MGVLKKIANKVYRIINPPGIYWKGNYASWEDALSQCPGYNSDAIITAISKSAAAVKEGRASYERDGYLFYTPSYNWSLLFLIYRASHRKDKLTILDFGGALGSQYYQNRTMFQGLKITWVIVEQPEFIEIGRKDYESETLKFEYSIEDALSKYTFDICLFSSVLQYLGTPETITAIINKANIPYVYLDRTSFSNKKQIAIQYIKKFIYESSYPTHFFEPNEMKTFFPDYKVIAEFDSEHEPSIVLNGMKSYWKGFILKYRN